MSDTQICMDERKGRHAVVVSDPVIYICEMKHTDSDNPDNGWFTFIPYLVLQERAVTVAIRAIQMACGEVPEVYKCDPDIKFRKDIRQVAQIKDDTVCKLSKATGDEMMSALWMDDKGRAIEVDIHSEGKTTKALDC